MTLRLTYQPWGETLDELVDAGRRAEEAGAEVLWTSELHRSASIQAAALASATDTAKIGTSIMLGFTRSPMITALEALDLDELSHGRFLLGLGSGVQRLNESWHNVPFGKAVPHLRETIRNLRLFWETSASGDDMTVEGDYEPMSIRGYERPFQALRTDIPIYVAAMGTYMTRLAGSVGNGWIGHELGSPAYLESRILPDLVIGLENGRVSRDRFDVVASACCSVSSDAAVARHRAAGVVGFYATVRTYADFFDFHGLADGQQAVIAEFRSGTGADHLHHAVTDDMVDALTLAGTRDEVAERIAAYDGIADSIKLSPPTHGIGHDETREAQESIIALIAEHHR